MNHRDAEARRIGASDRLGASAVGSPAGRVILLTGASRGIGRGLAERYLERGDTVCGCSRGPSDLSHPRYTHRELDVADEAAVVRFVRAVARQHGRIDALLANAGIASMNAALLTPAATLRSVLATNVEGTFLFAREVAKVMVRQKAGRIVTFTSVAAPLNLEGESAYAASKAAVESLTRVLARELAPAGVTVNAVGPTPIPTDLLKGVPKNKIDQLLARQPLRRLGTIEEVAHVVDFFLNPASGGITGQIVYLGGVSP